MNEFEFPEVNLEKFNRTKTAIQNICKQAEVDKKLLMFDVGDIITYLKNRDSFI